MTSCKLSKKKIAILHNSYLNVYCTIVTTKAAIDPLQVIFNKYAILGIQHTNAKSLSHLNISTITNGPHTRRLGNIRYNTQSKNRYQWQNYGIDSYTGLRLEFLRQRRIILLACLLQYKVAYRTIHTRVTQIVELTCGEMLQDPPMLSILQVVCINDILSDK